MQSKSPFHSRYRLFDKITHLFFTGMKLSINSEYAPEYIKEAAQKYAGVCRKASGIFFSLIIACEIFTRFSTVSTIENVSGLNFSFPLSTFDISKISLMSVSS